MHNACEGNVSHLPFVSCTINSDGERRLQVRPPLRQAIEKFFKLPGDELPVQSGKQVEDLTVFPLQFMQERDVVKCKAITSSNFVTIYDAFGKVVAEPGRASKTDTPRFLMHGTTVEHA